MIEVAILVPIMWIVMSALYMFLLKNIEGTKGITSEYHTKDGVKRTAVSYTHLTLPTKRIV